MSGQQTSSIWDREPKGQPDAPPLRQDAAADVCVVGAGIAGLSVAYFLAREGREVIVLDAAGICGGDTGLTTAHLASALDDRFTELEQMHGERGSRLAAHSHAAAIDRIEAIVREEKIACDFRRLNGYLFQAPGQEEHLLLEEMDAARRAGLKVNKVAGVPGLPATVGTALEFEDQARFDPAHYLAGLARAFVRRGGRIFGDTFVNDVKGGPGAHVITRDGHRVAATSLVVATNSPMNNRIAIHTKQAAYRTYAIALKVPNDVPDALYWDTADPYHYVRLFDSRKGRVLIVGGEDHRTGQDDGRAHWDLLEAWARSMWPNLGERVAWWSGQVLEPVDGLAFIGRLLSDEPNVYIATGDSGHGMTHGTIAGQLITDLILGRENEWATLYDPGRKTLQSATAFLGENLNTAAQYTDWLTGGDVSDGAEIKPGEGALIRVGLTKVAAYRDEKGELHCLSATCPHLGGVVRWNGVEKTWDCPCHGSRFGPTGEVLNGPSPKPLEPTEAEACATSESGQKA